MIGMIGVLRLAVNGCSTVMNCVTVIEAIIEATQNDVISVQDARALGVRVANHAARLFDDGQVESIVGWDK